MEVISFGIRFLMTISQVFLLNMKWLSVIQAGCALLLLWLYFKWVRAATTMQELLPGAFNVSC